MERKRKAVWDGVNMKVLSTKLRNKDAAEIAALCQAENRTVYNLLKDLLKTWRDSKRGSRQPFDCYKH